MSHKLFYICNVVAESEEDYKILLEYLGNYPVGIYRKLPDELYFEIPTLVIGWNFIKDKFTSQNITDKQIEKNLFWAFSKKEKEKDFYKQVEDFFIESVKRWLPQDFKLYDPYLNSETLDEFLKKNIEIDKKLFVYFHEGALYMNNAGNNFLINIKSLSIHDKYFKQTITNIFNLYDVLAFSYHNFGNYVHLDLLKDVLAIDSLRWVKYGVETLDSYFNIIPNFTMYKYIPFLMSRLNSIDLDVYEQAFYSRMCKRDEITCWLSNREIAFAPAFEKNKLDFKIRKNCKLAKINYSDKRTITGRITSRDVYNPQNLEKANDERKDIISRFEGGSILVFDYVSFEPKISIYESGNKKFIEKFKNKDLHYEIAVLLYENKNITNEQRKFAKTITNPLLYGEGEVSLLNKLSVFEEPEYKLFQTKELLRPIIEKSNEIIKEVEYKGYVKTPQGIIVKVEKAYAGFNNYIQAYASEIMVDKLFEIKKMLQYHKTQFLFQVHDSLVFDLHPLESFLIIEIKKILSKYNDMEFDLNIEIGCNYKELKKL